MLNLPIYVPVCMLACIRPETTMIWNLSKYIWHWNDVVLGSTTGHFSLCSILPLTLTAMHVHKITTLSHYIHKCRQHMHEIYPVRRCVDRSWLRSCFGCVWVAIYLSVALIHSEFHTAFYVDKWIAFLSKTSSEWLSFEVFHCGKYTQLE